MKSMAISKPYVSLSQSSSMSAPSLNLLVRLLIWSSVYSIVSTVCMPPWAMIGPHVNLVSSRECTIIRPPMSRSPSTTASFFSGHTYGGGSAAAAAGTPKCLMWRMRTSGNGVCNEARRNHPALWFVHSPNGLPRFITVVIVIITNTTATTTTDRRTAMLHAVQVAHGDDGDDLRFGRTTRRTLSCWP